MPETIMAFDFGMRRIGVAIGEATMRTAHPLTTIRVPAADVFTAIEPLVNEWKPSKFVVGRPAHADGTASQLTARCERFSRQLAGRFRLPAVCVDEFASSLEAESSLRAQGVRACVQHSNSDALAATLILERYFETAS